MALLPPAALVLTPFAVLLASPPELAQIPRHSVSGFSSGATLAVNHAKRGEGIWYVEQKSVYFVTICNSKIFTLEFQEPQAWSGLSQA